MLNLLKSKKIVTLIIAIIGSMLFVLLFFIISRQPEFGPISFLPKNKAENISTNPEIRVVFSRRVSSEEKAHISLLSSPSIHGNYVWGNDDKSLFFQLYLELEPSTKYQLFLSLYNRKYSWSFSTVSELPLSTAEQIKIQGKADLLYSQQLEDFNQKYPWYNEIPSSNDKYFIIFDGSINTFYIELYPKKSAATSIDKQVGELKKLSLGILKNLGVNTNSYKIVWKIIPAP